jgi:hypothetical protein
MNITTPMTRAGDVPPPPPKLTKEDDPTQIISF